MTRLRTYGRDIAFMGWMRDNPRLDSRLARFAPTDIDVIVHQYPDRKSTNPKRRVDNMMIVETKSHARGPALTTEFNAQNDTYAVFNALMLAVNWRGSRTGRVIQSIPITVNGSKRRVRWWGVHVLAMSDDTPESGSLWWDDRVDPISKDTLEDILRFDRHPFSLKSLDYRDHHINELSKWPLLIPVRGEVA